MVTLPYLKWNYIGFLHFRLNWHSSNYWNVEVHFHTIRNMKSSSCWMQCTAHSPNLHIIQILYHQTLNSGIDIFFDIGGWGRQIEVFQQYKPSISLVLLCARRAHRQSLEYWSLICQINIVWDCWYLHKACETLGFLMLKYRDTFFENPEVCVHRICCVKKTCSLLMYVWEHLVIPKVC